MTCSSAKPEPVFQCFCERCDKELFDGTPRASYHLCNDCEEELYWRSPEGMREAETLAREYREAKENYYHRR